MRFADLHNHLLPGVDDGARSLDETLRCLARFAAEGVADVVLTPHLARPSSRDAAALALRMQELRSAFARVREAVGERADLPRVHFGQEVFAPNERHLGKLLEAPGGLGLGDTPYLLVEFGFAPLDQPEAVIERAHAAGRRIVIAHPERYTYASTEAGVEAARRWRELGAFLQVNLGSLRGDYEEWTAGSQRLGWRLLEEGLAHLLASDDHGDGRPQLLQRSVYRRLAQEDAEAQARRLLSENPLRMLQGDLPLEVDPFPVPALREG